MNRKRTVSVLLIVVLSVSFVFARDLSLDEAVSLALEQNLQLKSSKITLDMSKSEYGYSYNTFIPDVNATATMMKQNEADDFAFTYGISGTWNFNPAMITNVRIAKEKYDSGEITYLQACAQMKQNIRKVYYGVLLQQEALAIQQETLKSQESRYLQAKLDYENGYIPEISLLQSQVAYQNARPTYEQALTNLKNAKRQLAFLLGLDLNEELNLTSSIDCKMVDVDVNQVLSKIDERFDVQLLESKKKLTKMQKEAIIESTFIPSISLQASWQPYLFDINMKGKDYWTDQGKISGTVAWNLTNLLPSSSSYKNLKDINKGLDQIELGKQMTIDNARIEILNILDKLEQSRFELDSSETTVSLAQANYEMRLTSYNTGTSDYLDLKDAETQLSQAKLGRLNSKFNYISALIDLEYATNQQIF